MRMGMGMALTANKANGQKDFLAALLPADLNRVAAIYTDPDRPSTAAPHRAALIGEGDIANDVSRLVVNQTTVDSLVDQGIGTYTEQDVFFGARAGVSLFANLREFSPALILFLQPSDSLPASHLARLQKGYAKAAGVTL